jgi:hypothetical protein
MNARNLLRGRPARAGFRRTVGYDRAGGRFLPRGRRRRSLVEGEVIAIDDFAHHPTAIAATLARRSEPRHGRRVWALFDPRSNTSRRRVFRFTDPPPALRAPTSLFWVVAPPRSARRE